MRIVLKSLLDFFKHGGMIYAGCITGFFLMSFIPFCLLLFSILGYFLSGNEKLYDFLIQNVGSFFPQAAQQTAEMLSSVIIYRKVGIFTAIVYFYFSYQLYMALETAVNRIFGIKSRRSVFVSLFFAVTFITLIIIFIVVSFAVTSAVSLPDLVARFFAVLRINGIMALLIGNIMTIILAFVMVTLLYVLLPAKRISLKHASLGGAFTSVLLEAAKYLFTYYMLRQSIRYGAIYGPLTSFVVFLLWILYASSIFLMGAAVVHNLEEEADKDSVA